jgi:tetratricopeptide (TPR) repeat protein
MTKIENTVYICSFRAYKTITARLVQSLEQLGYCTSCYVDDVAKADIDEVVIPNVRANAHFITFVTPNILLRLYEPSLPYRRQIEAALQHQRNIIPLMFVEDGFDNPHVAKFLKTHCLSLKQFQPVIMGKADTFETTVANLHTRLQQPVDTTLATDAPPLPDFVAEITQNSLQAEFVYECGNIYYWNKDYVKAKAEYDTAIALKPDFNEAYNNRGMIVRLLGDLDSALNDLNEAIRLNPDVAENYCNRSIIFTDLKRHEDALADAQRALDLAPELAAAYNNRGVAYSDMGEIPFAIEDYSRSIELDPTHSAMVYHNRAIERGKVVDYAEAFSDYAMAIEISKIAADTSLADVYDSRGSLHRKMGNIELAKTDFLTAIAIKPEFSRAYNGLALVYEQEGNIAAALDNINKAIELSPDDEVLLVNRANLYIKMKIASKALEDIEKALTINVNYVLAYNMRGILYMNAGLHRSAIQEFTQAIALKSENKAVFYANRGYAHYNLGNWKEARADWYAALELDPGLKPAHEGLDLIRHRGNGGFWSTILAIFGFDGSKKKQ